MKFKDLRLCHQRKIDVDGYALYIDLLTASMYDVVCYLVDVVSDERVGRVGIIASHGWMVIVMISDNPHGQRTRPNTCSCSAHIDYREFRVHSLIGAVLLVQYQRLCRNLQRICTIGSFVPLLGPPSSLI